MSEKAATARQRLLDAAASVFSECGYARATTKEIARAAGVAEGTIYRHFADKRELFRAVFNEQSAASFEGLLNLPDLAGKATVRGNLERLVLMLEDVEAHVVPLQAAIWSDAQLAAALLPAPAGSGPAGMGGTAGTGEPQLAPLTPLTQYLEAEQALGRVRKDIDAGRAAFAIFAIPFLAVMTARMATVAGHAGRVDIMGALDVVLKGLEP